MPEKPEIILSEEESFARRVALSVIVRRPVKAWMQLIPGMFIFDFLKRTQEMRRFSEYHLHPRRLALQAANEMAGGADKDQTLWPIPDRVRKWLAARSIYSDAATEAQMHLIHLLVDHYAQLLQSNGETYFALIRGAYKDQAEYESFLRLLSLAEQAVCRTISQNAPENDIFWKDLHARLLQAEELREKDSEAIYFGHSE